LWEEIDLPVPEVTQRKVPDNEALRFAANLKAGWNLGNTMDAHGNYTEGLNWETAWGNPKTTREIIGTVAAAGFKTVRIPVTWHVHMDDGYTIDGEWMGRVEEIVGYALEENLYVILNIHHDDGEDWLYPDQEHAEASAAYLQRVWTQVAARFKDYGEELVFEGMNEPRLTGTPYEWDLASDAEVYAEVVESVNALNQVFVDTVRASGGGNETRYLMVPSAGAGAEAALHEAFALPVDTVENRIILSNHSYRPWNFVMAEPDNIWSWSAFDMTAGRDTEDINRFMDGLYDKFISQGVPVVIGEFGVLNTKGELSHRVEWASYYVASAAARGIPCVYWDDGGNYRLLDRSELTWLAPELVAALIRYS
jgi:endoglucanase